MKAAFLLLDFVLRHLMSGLGMANDVYFTFFALGLEIACFVQLNTVKGKVAFLQKYIWSLEQCLEREDLSPRSEKSYKKRKHLSYQHCLNPLKWRRGKSSLRL